MYSLRNLASLSRVLSVEHCREEQGYSLSVDFIVPRGPGVWRPTPRLTREPADTIHLTGKLDFPALSIQQMICRRMRLLGLYEAHGHRGYSLEISAASVANPSRIAHLETSATTAMSCIASRVESKC